MRRDVGGDLDVQVQLPVHALGNGLDDEIALAQQGQVLLIVGRLDTRGLLGQTQRRGLDLLEVVDGLQGDSALGALGA